MRGHQEALPHGIIPYQHSNNRPNEPRTIFILENLTLNSYPQNQKPPFLRSWPPFLHFSKAQRFFRRFQRIKGLSSSPYLFPYIWSNRTFFHVRDLRRFWSLQLACFVAAIFRNTSDPADRWMDGWMDRPFFYFPLPPSELRTAGSTLIRRLIEKLLRFRFSYLTHYTAVKLKRVAPLFRRS